MKYLALKESSNGNNYASMEKYIDVLTPEFVLPKGHIDDDFIFSLIA